MSFKPRESAAAFGKLAMFAGPAIAVVGVLVFLGWFPPDNSSPYLGFYDQAPPEVPVATHVGKDQTNLWAFPASVDPSSVTCEGKNGQIDLSAAQPGAEAVTKAVGPDDAPSWVLLSEDIDQSSELRCSGGGVEKIGLEGVSDPVDNVGMGVFFLVGGLIVAGLGWIARRASAPAR